MLDFQNLHPISDYRLLVFYLLSSADDDLHVTRGGVTIEFSEMRGPNKIFGSFILQNEPNILFGPLISENSIVTPPLSKI